MAITPQDQELAELLQRNLFIKPTLKQKILEADAAKKAEVLPLIREIDGKQTSLFKQVLTENPHFFADLENMAIHEALKKLMETEARYRQGELLSAEQELTQKLKQV